MKLLIDILIVFVALEHFGFLWMEMFGWTTRAKKVFRGFPDDYFEKTKTLAANQGLYNGFLAAGLVWSLFVNDAFWANQIAMFFLGCVAVAGVFGAFTANKKIFFIQALPAIIAVILLLFV